MPCASSRSAQGSSVAQEEEVGRRRSDVVAGRDERRPHPLAFLDRRIDVTEPGRAERCRGDCRRRPGDRCRRPALGEQRRGRRVRYGVAHAERGEAEGLRHRPDHDEVLELVDPRRARPRAILDVRLVDHHCRLRLAARELDQRLRLDPAADGVVRVADPAELRLVLRVDHGPAVQPGGDAVERIRRPVDRRTHSGPEERLRDEEDEVVCACADDDVLRGEPDVGCRGLAEVAVRAVGVLLEPRHALGERHLRHPRERRRVLVELEHGLGRNPVTGRDLVDARSPRVRRKALADLLRAQACGAHAATAAPWSGRPSTRASGPTTSAARRAPSADAVTTWSGFRNASMPRPPVERASPPVGRTCVAPAA